MWHDVERAEMCSKFWLENMKGRHVFEDPVMGRYY
jgi:hypothetical protein